MPAAHGGDPTSASSCEADEFLDFGDGLRLDVELGGGVECARPGGLSVIPSSAERNVVVELAQLGGDCGVHFTDSGTSSLNNVKWGLSEGVQTLACCIQCMFENGLRRLIETCRP